MAHLFLPSKVFIPDEPTSKNAIKVPKSVLKMPTANLEKSNNNNTEKDRSIIVTTGPLINEGQLMAATGGAEISCYRCTVPFGVVVLIAGIVVTTVAYTFNSHGSTISVLGLFLLSSGLALLGSSAVCWRVRLGRKKDRRRESQTALMANHGLCVA
ncbi:transmembrane protein 100 [Esox lucius]|uniref:Transmembrane protein 100 n=1 Tax=Esox lucius TaxID=8010 RepID=A0AAY5KZ76_ESOLU|nr:transmembrane protein 100 [Esox lucius]